MITTSYFEFNQHTELISGVGTRAILPNLIKKCGAKRAVIFSDKVLTKVGITNQIIDAITASSEINLVGTFDSISSDAKSSDINAAVKYFKDVDGDILIAVGGGSVIDTVKAVKWCIDNHVQTIENVLTDVIVVPYSKAKPFKTPHITLPTTAGTGSEVSQGAVIFNEQLNKKCTINHPYIASDIAILDPDLTMALPPSVTASTGMDALTHAIEALFSPNATNFSQALAKQAIEVINENLPLAVHEGTTNYNARANMLQASSMAIMAFFLVNGPYPVHNFAHAFGAKYRIPHGLANAVLLPLTIKHMPTYYAKSIRSLATLLNTSHKDKTELEIIENVAEYISDLNKELGLPSNFNQFNIQSSEFEDIIIAVQTDPVAALYQMPLETIQNVVTETICIPQH